MCKESFRTELELLHDILQLDQFHDIHRAVVRQHIVPGIKIHDHCLAAKNKGVSPSARETSSIHVRQMINRACT